ncbi:MAG: EF-P lysine aminoacylase GenX [Desulfobacteraceae bacterium]|nr:EF-P lysine aminoacylase GenX [Desulfobacteraceae bacterium]
MLEALRKRAIIINAIRAFFQDNDFLEVDTPLRLPSIIPEAHIDSFDTEGWFLQASPELCMKRLISQGYNKIFQICKCFRKNERSDKHLPELTMLEWYAKNQTYLDLMDTCQKLIEYIANKTETNGIINYQNLQIDLNTKFLRLSVKDAFLKYTHTTMEKACSTGKFDEIMSFEIEPNLGLDKPVFLYDYPASLGALAKLKPENPDLAERFELYIAGIELANGFSELIDPEEQKIRFEAELNSRKAQGKKNIPMPEKFLNDLSSMPETAGIAFGIDRLIMLFCNLTSIDQSVAFTPEQL